MPKIESASYLYFANDKSSNEIARDNIEDIDADESATK